MCNESTWAQATVLMNEAENNTKKTNLAYMQDTFHQSYACTNTLKDQTGKDKEIDWKFFCCLEVKGDKDDV